jgi:hypothetical protein
VGALAEGCLPSFVIPKGPLVVRQPSVKCRLPREPSPSAPLPTVGEGSTKVAAARDPSFIGKTGKGCLTASGPFGMKEKRPAQGEGKGGELHRRSNERNVQDAQTPTGWRMETLKRFQTLIEAIAMSRAASAASS